MGLLLAVLLITWAFKRAVSDAIVDNNLAKQGKISPRLEARHGPGAGAKVAGYGMFDYFQDAWHDYWGRRGDALVAAKTAQPAPGRTRVTLSDRLNAGIAKLNDGAQRAADSPAVRTILDPVGPKAGPPPPVKPPPGPPPTVPIAESDDADEGTRRFTDTGEEEMFNGRWRPVPKRPDSPPANRKPSTGGTMTAPTGEAVNYETTVAELEALVKEQQMHIDACIGAQSALAAAKTFIGDMQESYRASSAAAATTHEHLAVLHLDGATLADTGTTADAMPAGAVDTYYDQLEGMEAMAKERRDAAEVALHSTEAALGNIQAKYGDAATTVAGDLSGDARFLDNGTSTTVAA